MNRKLILFYSPICGKCHAINRRIERLQKEGLFPLEYELIDTSSNEDEMKRYHVEGVPTVILLKNDMELRRLTGSLYREDIIDLIK